MEGQPVTTCPDCGAALESKNVSCPSCGRSLGEATVFGLAVPRPARGDMTAATRARLEELASGWELPGSPKAADPPPAAPPTPAAPAAQPTAEEGGTLPRSVEPAPAPARVTIPLDVQARQARERARGEPRDVPALTDEEAAPPAEKPHGRTLAMGSLPPDAEMAKAAAPPRVLTRSRAGTPTPAPHPSPAPIIAVPATSAHEDETRTVMELPPFARGQRPEGVGGALIYTWRALRADVNRRMQLRRLRADAAEKAHARDERLTELGEVALTVPELVAAALDAARPHIASLDDSIEAAEKERGAVVAAVANEERQAAEAVRVSAERARDIQAKMDELDAQIRPLHAEHKTQDKALRDAEQTFGDAGKKVEALAAKRAAAEARGAEGAPEVADCSARIAALDAEREAAERAIPALRDRVAELAPQIEKLRVEWEAARGTLEANRKLASDREAQKKETLRKLDERRAAVEQQLARAQGDRKVALRDLGAKLDWDRIAHPELAPRYRALDELGGALTTIEYQIAELSREAGAVDKRAVALASMAVLVGLFVLSFVAWLIFG